VWFIRIVWKANCKHLGNPLFADAKHGRNLF